MTDFTVLNAAAQSLIDAQAAADSTTYTTALAAAVAAKDAVIAADAVALAAKQAELDAYKLANPDKTPPAIPTGLTATVVSATQIDLVWNASTDNSGPVTYQVYRGAGQVGSPTSPSYSNTGLTPATAYTFKVRSKDAAGNFSGYSTTVTATTAGAAPPPPPPPPPGFVWPSAANTGVPAGTVLTPYTGPAVISTPNTIVDSKVINIGIAVTTSGVIFRKCMFTANDVWALNGDTATDLIVEDCEFTSSVKTILGQGTFSRLNIHGSNIGITLKDGKSTIKGCYIHDLAANGVAAPHYDGIFIAGGQTDCLVEDNLISIPSNGGTSSIFIATRWQGSNIVNTTINHNRLLGTPSYAMYSEQTAVATISGTKWTNNEVQKGAFGYWTITANSVAISGNVDAFSGVNIDAM